jgi:hypothetical protein
MLPSPRTIRKISRSSIPAEQERVIAFPNEPLEKSGGRVLTLHQSWRRSTSFRLGGAFSPSVVCLRCKSRINHRVLGFEALAFDHSGFVRIGCPAASRGERGAQLSSLLQ